MRCPYCRHADTRVVDSRDANEGDAIRRRLIASPSLASLLSTTRVSAWRQYGQRIGPIPPQAVGAVFHKMWRTTPV